MRRVRGGIQKSADLLFGYGAINQEGIPLNTQSQHYKQLEQISETAPQSSFSKRNLIMNRIQPSNIFIRRLFGTSLTISAIAISVLASSAQIAQASRCRTIAQHWDGLVDVRSSPKNRLTNLITTLPNGTELDVIGQQGDWLEIYTQNNRLGANYQTGWVAANQTRRICFRDSGQGRRNRNYDNYDN